MKRFFEDGLDVIIKMAVTQLGMTMFGIMVTAATVIVPQFANKERNVLSLIASIAATAMYLFLIYIHIWDKGAKDKIKIDGGRMQKQDLKGLYFSLVANALNILLGIVALSTYYFCDFVNSPNSMVCQIFGTSNDIARIIQGMYVGLLNYISPNAAEIPPIMFLVITLPALLTSALGYYLGSHNVKITNLLFKKH